MYLRINSLLTVHSLCTYGLLVSIANVSTDTLIESLDMLCGISDVEHRGIRNASICSMITISNAISEEEPKDEAYKIKLRQYCSNTLDKLVIDVKSLYRKVLFIIIIQ